MAEVRDRSDYVDNLTFIIKRYFVPYEIWWYSLPLSDAFEKAFEHNAKPLIFFPVLSFVALNIHNDNIVEAKELSKAVYKFCDNMIAKVNKYLTSNFDIYWDFSDGLENKTLGKEAMLRLENQFHSKQAKEKSGASLGAKKEHPEFLPGYESEGWAHKNIASLIGVRKRLFQIITAAHKMGAFFIFNREYNIEYALHEAVTHYFHSKLKKLICPKGDICRPSVVLHNIIIGCGVMQSLCQIISCDFIQILKTFLYDNFCDKSISPPGVV
jgi:hypothetical protein